MVTKKKKEEYSASFQALGMQFQGLEFQ